MPEYPALTPSPARVHQRARALTGRYPRWIEPSYAGGLFQLTFRICSICRCVHPTDLIELLCEGRSGLEPSPGRSDKFLFTTPNPIAGDLVRMGSVPGAVFDRSPAPKDLRHRLMDPSKPGLAFVPTMRERLAGHFERPALAEAPAMISWPFFIDHTTDRQWPEITAALQQGEEHALPGA